MKAIVQDGYGSPASVLRLTELDLPPVNDDQVLVRVHAASVNSGDWRRVAASPSLVRLMEGIRAPKTPRLGGDAAGIVEAVGKDVTHLNPGDEVYGYRTGAFGEYVAGRMFAPKPVNLDFQQAAAVPIAAGTALEAVRDKGELQAGQRVLITGAGGGVGTYAVQIAKALGGHVTAVTRADNLEFIRSIGADEAIGYGAGDFTRTSERYDLLVDIAARTRLSKLRWLLTPEGTLVRVGAGHGTMGVVGGLVAAQIRSRLLGQRVVTLLADVTQEHLATLKEMIEAGKITPVIDRTFTLADVPAAVAYAEQERARGKIVISVV